MQHGINHIAAALDELACPPDPKWANLHLTAEIGGISLHTQSVGLGATTFAISTISNGYALSYGGGPRVQDAGSDPEAQFSSLIPLVEEAGAYLPAACRGAL